MTLWCPKHEYVSWKNFQIRKEVRAAVQKLHINLQPVLSMFLTVTKDMVYSHHAKNKPTLIILNFITITYI